MCSLRRVYPVAEIAGTQDHPPDARRLGGLKHVPGPLDVDLHDDVRRRREQVGDGRQVHDGVVAGEGLRQGLAVRNVCLDEIDIRPRRRGGVDGGHSLTVRHRGRDVGAEPSRAPRHRDAFKRHFPELLCRQHDVCTKRYNHAGKCAKISTPHWKGRVTMRNFIGLRFRWFIPCTFVPRHRASGGPDCLDLRRHVLAGDRSSTKASSTSSSS